MTYCCFISIFSVKKSSLQYVRTPLHLPRRGGGWSNDTRNAQQPYAVDD